MRLPWGLAPLIVDFLPRVTRVIPILVSHEVPSLLESYGRNENPLCLDVTSPP